MSLIEDIIDGAASEQMPLGTLLRKCMILASTIGSQAAVDWVEWELNGYPADIQVPAYRSLNLIIKASMQDLTTQVSGWVVPPALLGTDAKSWCSHDYRDSVGAIEHALSTLNGSLHFAMGNLLLFLTQQKFTHMHINAAWGEASSSTIKNILESVRNRVLKFALDLRKEYPDAAAAEAPRTERAAKIDQLFINNIYGAANVVGTAQHSNFILSNTKGDFAALRSMLAQHGVENEDLANLEEALEAEQKPTSRGFGPRVSEWVAGMMKKAANGSWQIATSVAGGLLEKALSKYYGLS